MVQKAAEKCIAEISTFSAAAHVKASRTMNAAKLCSICFHAKEKFLHRSQISHPSRSGGQFQYDRALGLEHFQGSTGINSRYPLPALFAPQHLSECLTKHWRKTCTKNLGLHVVDRSTYAVMLGKRSFNEYSQTVSISSLKLSGPCDDIQRKRYYTS